MFVSFNTYTPSSSTVQVEYGYKRMTNFESEYRGWVIQDFLHEESYLKR
jgi:hypothetical protein